MNFIYYVFFRAAFVMCILRKSFIPTASHLNAFLLPLQQDFCRLERRKEKTKMQLGKMRKVFLCQLEEIIRDTFQYLNRRGRKWDKFMNAMQCDEGIGNILMSFFEYFQRCHCLNQEITLCITK